MVNFLRFRDSRAVALLDSLVAAVILGLAMATIVSLSGQASNSQQMGQQIATAAMLADEQLNLVLARGADSYEKDFETDGVCDPPFESFRYKLEFSGGGTGAYDVTVTITWTAWNGEQSYSVSTSIAPRPGEEPDPDRRPAETVEREP